MKAHFYKSYAPKRRDPDDDPFDVITVYVPKSLSYMLKSKSDEIAIPVSRLVLFAIDNELDVDTPFYYPCPDPTSPYVPFAYADEAGKILSFLSKFPSGTGRDTLMLCRRDIGIPSRTVFMLAYRELLDSGQVEEFHPKRTKFRYNRDYLYTRIVDTDPKKMKKNRYKRIEGESTKYDLGTRTTRDIEEERDNED